MLTTRAVRITDMLDQMWPLLSAHVRELATHPDIMHLDPQVETYKRLEAEGRLLSIVLEHSDAGLVGYSINILSNNLHYQALTVCQNDVIYVTPSYRSEGGGTKLLRATEIAAQIAGCKMVLMHAKPDTMLDKILPSFGYGVQDVIYSRVLL
jgi:GNAT superfamily N-acetyltransferase